MVQREIVVIRVQRDPRVFKAKLDLRVREASPAVKAPRANRVPQVLMDPRDPAVLEAHLVRPETTARMVSLAETPIMDPKALVDLQGLLANAVSPAHKVLRVLLVNLAQKVTPVPWVLGVLWVPR